MKFHHRLFLEKIKDKIEDSTNMQSIIYQEQLNRFNTNDQLLKVYRILSLGYESIILNYWIIYAWSMLCKFGKFNTWRMYAMQYRILESTFAPCMQF